MDYLKHYLNIWRLKNKNKKKWFFTWVSEPTHLTHQPVVGWAGLQKCWLTIKWVGLAHFDMSSEGKVNLNSSSQGEKQDQNKPFVVKENIFEILCIKHKTNKELNENAPKNKYFCHSPDKRCMNIGSYTL